METIQITIQPNTPAEQALKAFIAEKEARRLDQQKKAAEYASKFKKPAL